jgi:DNA topoisomerase VI subunit A
VVGDLEFSYYGSVIEDVVDYKADFIDYKTADLSGRPIPILVDKIRDIKSGALFILLVESNALLTVLHSAKFEEKYRCIIVSGSGVPDMATRKFLRKIRFYLNLPVLALMDGDISGFNILVCYKNG